MGPAWCVTHCRGQCSFEDGSGGWPGGEKELLGETQLGHCCPCFLPWTKEAWSKLHVFLILLRLLPLIRL